MIKQTAASRNSEPVKGELLEEDVVVIVDSCDCVTDYYVSLNDSSRPMDATYFQADVGQSDAWVWLEWAGLLGGGRRDAKGTVGRV